MKKVTELKDGMKVWIPFDVIELTGDLHYPFRLKNNVGHQFTCTKNGTVLFNEFNEEPVEMYEQVQEEIPELIAKKMEVSRGGEDWKEVNIIGKKGDAYIDNYGYRWYHVRPIQKKVTLEIPEELLSDELRKYLKR